MEKNKFQWKRPELSLKEVTEQFDCTVDDIFHEAEMGKLTLYVKAEVWKVDFVFSNQLLCIVHNIKKFGSHVRRFLGHSPRV